MVNIIPKKLSSSAKIFIAGHRGLVGSAIVKALQERGYSHLLLRTRQELDLRNSTNVEAFFHTSKPDAVIVAAAKVGGILANSQERGDFILENLEIQTNIIGAAHRAGIQRLVFLGSSCIYPKLAPQPIPESAFLTGPLEETNEAYAVAKIAGIMLCKSLRLQYGRDYISIMPTNMYGPGDNYSDKGSHVIPGLIRRFHEAKISHAPQVVCWGTGAPLREFMYSSDLADASVFCLENYSDAQHLNIGSGQEVSIRKLAEQIRETVGYTGDIVWDNSKPDGTPRKMMDSSKLSAMGWHAKVSLKQGLKMAYADFLQSQEKGTTFMRG